MYSKELIRTIDFWKKSAEESGLFRRILTDKINIKSDEIIDIIGPRRSGKSSILKLLIKNMEKDSWLYINFEDPAFIENNNPKVIEELIETYIQHYGSSLKYLFFDEIQNIEYWEKAVRKLRDGSKYKIFITGSSSKLLSRELSSLITGRHLSYNLMPLNFREYLFFKNITVNNLKETVLQEAKIVKYFEKYLKLGGFPKIVLGENEELLKQYYPDILEKDIIKRHNIRQKDIVEKIGVFLLSNASKILSINSLEKAFNVSFEAASNYLNYFKEAFLVFEVSQFSYSLKTQQKALKKIYAVDTGLANAVSFRFSEDCGRILENCVFLHLNQIAPEVYYYKTKNNLEVDFLVKYQNQKMELIQVCADISDEKTKKRELKALLGAMAELGISSSLILTASTNEVVKINNRKVVIMPVYEWILGKITEPNEITKKTLGKGTSK